MRLWGHTWDQVVSVLLFMKNDIYRDLTTKKKELRKSIQADRDKISPSMHHDLSLSASRKFLGLDAYKGYMVIFAYYPFRSEIDIKILIVRALKDNKRIILPRVSGKGKLDLFYIEDLASDLEVGCFGLTQPRPDKQKKARLEDIDLVIVPGVAFYKDLNRLGYGGGFYDRILESLNRKIPKIALCFEMQLLDEIPVGKHDKKVDMIITEERIYEKDF